MKNRELGELRGQSRVTQRCDECGYYHDVGEKEDFGVCPVLYRRALFLKYERCIVPYIDWEQNVRMFFFIFGFIAFSSPFFLLFFDLCSVENCVWMLAIVLPFLVFLGYVSSISILRKRKKNKLDQCFEREFSKESACLCRANRLDIEAGQY